MSIPVAIDELERAIAAFGSAYFLTVGDGNVKVVTVDPRVVDGVLVIDDASRGSAANLAGNPAVTLVFPPLEPRGYTLLVDGTAEAGDHGFRVAAVSAVLHRPASHANGPAAPAFAGDPTGCGNDCRPAAGG